MADSKETVEAKAQAEKDRLAAEQRVKESEEAAKAQAEKDRKEAEAAKEAKAKEAADKAAAIEAGKTKVTNNYSSKLCINGVHIEPGESGMVPEFNAKKPLMKAWLAANVISVG